MNYRHIYHAGNFADVLKHVVLTRIVEYMKRKEKAFRVIDTHAGTGLYDLSSEEAQKTGEWLTGIGRLLEEQLTPKQTTLLAPYLACVEAENKEGGIRHYPGSPRIVRSLLRNQDRLSAIELHPADAATLRQRFEGDFQTRIIELDGWLALGAHVPPKEKRGLVLIDPPFEQPNEFERLFDGLVKAHKRWPGGTYALWYPVKHRETVEEFRNALRDLKLAPTLDVSLMIRRSSQEPRLDGTGMIIVNPPFTLDAEMKILMPLLSRVLALGPGANGKVEWLAVEE